MKQFELRHKQLQKIMEHRKRSHYNWKQWENWCGRKWSWYVWHQPFSFQIEHFALGTQSAFNLKKNEKKAIYCSVKSSIRYFLKLIVLVGAFIMEKILVVYKFSLIGHSPKYYNQISTTITRKMVWQYGKSQWTLFTIGCMLAIWFN